MKKSVRTEMRHMEDGRYLVVVHTPTTKVRSVHPSYRAAAEWCAGVRHGRIKV